MRQFGAFMCLRLALALVGSLLLHALLLGLLPFMGNGDKAKLLPAPSRLQVRMLPPVASDMVIPSPPLLEMTAQPGVTTELNPPRRQQTAVRQQPSLGVTSMLPQGELAAAQGNTGTRTPLVTPSAPSNPDRGTEQRMAAPPSPLNLNIPTTPIQPRTALQAAIEQQAIRPDAVARSFERALEQTAPVSTEISQTVDASGNATVKVRTAGGTYCLKNSTPAGATLYELKTLAGNCPK